MQAFCRPRRHDGAEIAARNAILFFQNLRIFLRIEKTERMIVDRATLTVGAQYINRYELH
ncbi:Uncharacterised protein [Shigella sonnei]|nr:Uncharacterised protein [Shigella sonnei]CSS95996.1 Uncharacterised protein [Shigella sonnei]